MKTQDKNSLVRFGKNGWGLIVYCAAMFFLYVGMINNGNNVTAPALAAKFGIESSAVLSMNTIAGVVSVIFFVVLGAVNRKIGARCTSAICMAAAGLAYIGVGQAPNLITYTVCMSVCSGTAMSAGYIAGGALVAMWYPKKKGIVMGYTTMGHNLAAVLYVPMITFLVSTFGIERGVLVPAAMAILVAVLGFVFIRNTPQERGQNPDGVSDEVYQREYEVQKQDRDGGWTVGRLLRTREMWLAAVTTGIYQLVSVGVMTQLVIRNMELGFTRAQATALMSFLACIGLVGSWFIGVLDQKCGTKRSMIYFGLIYIAALVCNITEWMPLVYVSILLIGVSIGGSANFTTSLPAAIFGRHGFEKVNSVIFPIQGLITAMNFLLSGISMQLTGTLRGVYLFDVAIILVNLVLIAMVDEHRYNRDYKVQKSLQ